MDVWEFMDKNRREPFFYDKAEEDDDTRDYQNDGHREAEEGAAYNDNEN